MAEYHCITPGITGDSFRLAIYAQSFLNAALAFVLIHNEARHSTALDGLAIAQSCDLVAWCFLSFALQSLDHIHRNILFHLSSIGFWVSAFSHWQTSEVVNLRRRRYHMATRQTPFRYSKPVRKFMTAGMIGWGLWLLDILCPGFLTVQSCKALPDDPSRPSSHVSGFFLFGLGDWLLPASSHPSLDVTFLFHVILVLIVSFAVWGAAWVLYKAFWIGSNTNQFTQDAMDEEWIGQLQCLWVVAAFWWVEEVFGIEKALRNRPTEHDENIWSLNQVVPITLIGLSLYGLWQAIHVYDKFKMSGLVGWFRPHAVQKEEETCTK